MAVSLRRLLTFFFIVSITIICLLHQQRSPKAALLQQINTLAQEAQVALIVTDLHHPEKPIFSLNASQYLQAASGMKLLTAIIAKKALPETGPFQSIIGITGQIKAQTLHGNVHLSTGANPSFDHKQLQEMLGALHKQGIRKVEGDFIIHQYHFHDTAKTPGTLWNEVDDCYATATSDISFAQNCFLLTLVKLNDRIIQYNPEPSQPIQLQIKVQENCNDQVLNATHDPAYGRGLVLTQNPFHTPETLRGCWYNKQPYWQLKRSLHDPEKTLRYHLEKNLAHRSMSVTGKVQTAQTPLPTLQWQYQIASPNLSTFLKTMLEKSNNHIANQLFIESAFQEKKQTTSWQEAQHYAKKLLKRYNIHTENAHLVDGAGLSRNSRITPQQLHSAVLRIYQDEQLRPLIPFLASPKNPESTLKYRLQKFALPLYAKTGEMKGIASLSGFIDPFGKNPKAFTLIINGNNAMNRIFHLQENNLLEKIASLS